MCVCLAQRKVDYSGKLVSTISLQKSFIFKAVSFIGMAVVAAILPNCAHLLN